MTFEVKVTHLMLSDRFLTQVSQFVCNFVTFEVKVAVSNELGRLCDVLGPKTKVVELDELNNFA